MNEIHVAICDSDIESMGYYERLCLEFGRKQGFEILIKTYKDSSLLINDAKNPDFRDTLDILLIEIYLNPLSGIETAKFIRGAGFNGAIIFVSNLKDAGCIEDVFDVMAFNFVRKKNGNIGRFENVLQRAIEAAGKMRCEYLLLSYAGDRRKIDINTIRYFEVQGDHLIRVNYAETDFAFFSTIGKLEKQLVGRRFCRVHTSFLVSMDHIEQISGNEILTDHGHRIPIGRSYRSNLLAMWKEWGAQ